MHNECVNIWTHLFGAACFVCLLIYCCVFYLPGVDTRALTTLQRPPLAPMGRPVTPIKGHAMYSQGELRGSASEGASSGSPSQGASSGTPPEGDTSGSPSQGDSRAAQRVGAHWDVSEEIAGRMGHNPEGAGVMPPGPQAPPHSVYIAEAPLQKGQAREHANRNSLHSGGPNGPVGSNGPNDLVRSGLLFSAVLDGREEGRGAREGAHFLDYTFFFISLSSFLVSPLILLDFSSIFPLSQLIFSGFSAASSRLQFSRSSSVSLIIPHISAYLFSYSQT